MELQSKFIFLTGDAIFTGHLFSLHLFYSLRRLEQSGYQFKVISNGEEHFSLFRQITTSEAIKGIDSNIFQIKKNIDPSNLLADLLFFAKEKGVDFKKSAFVHRDASFISLAKKLAIPHYQLDRDLNWSDLATLLINAPRTTTEQRVTEETNVNIKLNLDGEGRSDIDTGIPFLDHMLSQLAKHGNLDLSIHVQGDLEVDEHHTVEDTAITLGRALKKALGDKRGILRYSFLLPMDESLIQCALDLSGRSHLVFDGEFKREKVGGLPTELIKHFYLSLCEHLGANLHLQIRGENEHHKIEGSFKAFAKCLKEAVKREGTELPSTKGSL